MSEEEFFNRMINQISKVFDGRIATKMKNIYLKKDKQLNKQKEVLDKIKKYINKHCVNQDVSKEVGYKCFTMADTQELEHIWNLLDEIE